MKTLVVYESLFGNTEQLARAIAQGLGSVEVRDVAETTVEDLASADLLVLGGPTHAFSMTRETTRRDAHRQGAAQGADARGLRELIGELPAHLSSEVATFDTRVGKARHLPGSAARAATKDLRRHHGTKVLAQETFFVEDTPGPLLDGELDRAVAWGVGLRSRLQD